MSRPPESEKLDDRRARRTLLLAFGVIAAFLVAAHVIGYWLSRRLNSNIALIEENALESIRLVGAMGVDIERERNLMSRHINESTNRRMGDLEDALARVNADFATLAAAYVPLASFRGEAEAWHRLTADLALTEQPTARALELSRSNRDDEATNALDQLQPTYDAIRSDIDALTAINRNAADQATQETVSLQDHVLVARIVLAAAALLVTLLAMMWSIRVIVRMQCQLMRQRAELEERNRDLDAFAGRVAHDLRGPLNTLSLSASMIAEHAPGEQPTTTLMRRGIVQMTNLIDELLMLSRAGVAPRGLARTESIALSLRIELAPLAEHVGGALRVDLEPGVVACPPGLLRQVLWNLGENAVKYRRASTPLSIELVGRCMNGHYEIRISDNGVGLSTEDAYHVFEPFYRCERSSRIPGTGLGLAIVRRVVEAAGGTVSVRSELDRGTTFMLDLPLAAASDVRSPRQPVSATA